MKRFLLFAVAAFMFVGCNNAFEDKGNSRLTLSELPTLTAAFDEDADTRTYVENNKFLRWHEGDLLTAFYGNTLNRQYRFNGATGANSGTFSHVPSGELETGNMFDRIYAIYPYDAGATITDDGIISYSVPAVQNYAEASFGKDANTMVAVTENIEETFLGFKNLCGFLKVKLYGEGVVKSLELKGNGGEKIAGQATITATFDSEPEVVMADDAAESITLDCGEGVALSADAENPTEFWVVVPPTTFESGITITVTNTDGGVFEQTTTNAVAIERNEIQPMSAVAAEFVVNSVKPIYGDNFDGEEATKTYGSGSSWPYIDQFPQFANAEGPAATNVTYSGSGVTVRANLSSDSNYSDCMGSGSNNIFFGSNAYFQINNIALNGASNSFKLTFGSQNSSSLIDTSNFHIYLSKNGSSWSEIEYTLVGVDYGRWGVATAEFTLTEVPENLFIKFSADVASVYRIDDVALYTGNGGQQVTLEDSMLDTPILNLETDGVSNYTIYWDAIEGADCYVLSVDGSVYEPYMTTGTSYTLELTDGGYYDILVKAVGEDYADSEYATIRVYNDAVVDWIAQTLAPVAEDSNEGHPYDALQFTWKGEGVVKLFYGLFPTDNLVGVDDEVIIANLVDVDSSWIDKINSQDGLTAVFGSLSIGTSYTLCIFVINESGAKTLIKTEAATEVAEASEDVVKWLGTWSVNSHQICSINENGECTISDREEIFNVRITEGTDLGLNAVIIDGFSVLGEGWPTLGFVEGNELQIMNGIGLGSNEDGSMSYYWLAFYESMISMDYLPSYIATMDESGGVSSTGYISDYGACYCSDVFGVNDYGAVSFIDVETFPAVYRSGSMDWTKVEASVSALSAVIKPNNLSILPSSLVVAE